MTKRLALAATALALAAPLVTASPAAAAQWCNGTVVEDNGHTAGKHCWASPDGTDTQWRVQAKFCGPTGCFWAYGQWKTFGESGRSKAHSDYATFNGDLYVNTR